MAIIALGIILICITLLFGSAVGIIVASLAGAAFLLFGSSALLVALGVDLWMIAGGIIVLFLLISSMHVHKELKRTEKPASLKEQEDQALRDFRKLFP